jgi:hypothetical protein
MGKNSIERGSQDSWTPTPKKIAAVQTAIARDNPTRASNDDPVMLPGGGTSSNVENSKKYFAMFHSPENRDPRGFILPSDQPDFPTAVKFVNIMIRSGITVQRATSSFQVAGKTYPAGSYVFKTNQAFRPHVLDMFEPQDHPNDFRYPGGPPIPPYDNAGYTLAYQMGVKFDRILDGFDGPFETVNALVKPMPGKVAGSGNGFYMSHRANDAFIAINRLLKAGDEVYWVKQPQTVGGTTFEAGTFYIASKSGTANRVRQYATELGLNFTGGSKPKGEALKLSPVRIALLDRYGGSMPSGHTRWLLEQFEFPFDVIYPQGLDAGNLKAKYDALVLVDGMVPALNAGGGRGGRGGGGGEGGAPRDVPPEFQAMLGNVTPAKSIPAIKEFLDQGGTVITIGSSTALAQHLGLPLQNALVEDRNGQERPLPNDKFYVPGSILSAKLDTTLPINAGFDEHVDFFFDSSPAFKLGADAAAKNVRKVAWYDSREPLRSGWAWGQEVLENALAVAEADVGKGKVYFFGPEILFRAQPHGTFKYLFNSLYYGPASTAK